MWRGEGAEVGRQPGLVGWCTQGPAGLTTGGGALFITTFSATTPDK